LILKSGGTSKTLYNANHQEVNSLHEHTPRADILGGIVLDPNFHMLKILSIFSLFKKTKRGNVTYPFQLDK
jgi:hypothetical protein